ncbi:MAG: hypothetical protein JZD41_02410 [Thermoproteus sp.]|nr:hypothetical protein [Thermoproteus sp.]
MDIEEVLKIKDKLTALIGSYGVMGVGVGRKDSKWIVVVYTTDKNATKTALASFNLNVPIEIIETGPIKILH